MKPDCKRRYLLDVNVWLALFDAQHEFHDRAYAFIATPSLKIATCPLIENGVLRIANIPGFQRSYIAGFEAVSRMMQRVCADTNHEFWPDDITLRDADIIQWGRVSGHNQITDVYLLALAVKRNGTLASFDQRIALSAVRGATSENFALL